MTEVRPFGGSPCEGKKDESVPESGLVRNVCRQWVVHEDEGLAHRLQENEFRAHFGRNKEQHRTVQGDIKEAKKTQNEELSELESRHDRHVEQLRRLEERDRELAEQIQKVILQEESEIGHRRRHRDQLLALELQEQERFGFPAEPGQNPTTATRVTPAQDIVFQRDLSHRISTSKMPESPVFEAPVRPQRRTAARKEETRRQQEILDEELARRLQDEETQATIAREDYRLALESQDAEYARVLQDKEKERLRKAKEAQQIRREVPGRGEISVQTSAMRTNSISGNVSPVSPSIDHRLHSHPQGDNDRSTSGNVVRVQLREPDAQRYRPEQTNIATLIDPTYRRYQDQIDVQHFPDLMPAGSPGSRPTDRSVGVNGRRGLVQDNDAPHMPMNAQIRAQPFEQAQRARKQ